MLKEVKCFKNTKGLTVFYLVVGRTRHYLFSQRFKKGVYRFFSKGVSIDKAIDFTHRRDVALNKTISKLPIYIKFIEKEYEINVLKKTMRKKQKYAA